MGLTDILQSGGVTVHVDKKKAKQSAKAPVNRLESVCDYLDRQIAELEKRGTLEPKYNKGIREIKSWTAVDDEGKREIVLMCKNKKMYINEAAAKADKGIFIDQKDDSYDKVLKYLKHLRKEIGAMDLDDFNPWTRIKKTGEVKKIL